MRYTSYLHKETSAAPLAVFRIGFGIMMLFSIIRFWSHGWIEKLYIDPKWHFSYYGFEWVQPLGNWTYALFILCGLSAFMVALGFRYRLSIILFFLSFTYIELMDKTTYLNHYYFISVLSFLMIFLPAHARFSVDNYAFAKAGSPPPQIKKWCIGSIKVLLSIVYFYAGLAKLNSDWLLKAQPLKIWLQSKYDLPFIGANLMQQEWFYYAMSWSGMIYDLSIPFLLWYRKTRVYGYILVVIFHVFTRVLFPIGMFPYIMIVSTIIFFDSSIHERILSYLNKVTRWFNPKLIAALSLKNGIASAGRKTMLLVGLFLSLQVLFPFRHYLYPGELFWHEQGFRFSWRVMLMEKMGTSTFTVVDSKTGKKFAVDNSDFLTPQQEKQMSFQPDFILEYAHKLKEHFSAQGHQNIAIYVDSYVALNGRRSTRFIDPDVDLTQEYDSFNNKTWILPFNDEIKGL
jgi:hypothetical protein